MAVRLDAGQSHESFALAVEAKASESHDEVRQIQRQVAREVFTDVDVRPRSVVELAPATIPKTPSGKLRRAFTHALVTPPAPTGS